MLLRMIQAWDLIHGYDIQIWEEPAPSDPPAISEVKVCNDIIIGKPVVGEPAFDEFVGIEIG